MGRWALILLAVTMASLPMPLIAAEPAPSEKTYPFWDGKESVAEYAKRADLEPVKTLDLGDGVKMEFVLIPAGQFMMGMQEPLPPSTPPWLGSLIGIIAFIGFGWMAYGVFWRSLHSTQKKFQITLKQLLFVVFLLSVVVYGLFEFADKRTVGICMPCRMARSQ